MEAWRRLCIDMTEGGITRGASLEEYPGDGSELRTVHVLALGEAEGVSPHRLLDMLLAVRWYQPQLPWAPLDDGQGVERFQGWLNEQEWTLNQVARAADEEWGGSPY